jgi:alpha-tubulin suppressor-like RCC1 family protein
MKNVLASILLSVAMLLSSFSAFAAGGDDTMSTNENMFSFDANSLTKSDGSYWVWGGDQYRGYSVPTQILGLTDVKASFGQHYVMKNDGTVWQWERRPNSSEVDIVRIEGVNNVIATSYQNSLIVDIEGKVYKLPTDGSSTATLIPDIDHVTDITNYYNNRVSKDQWLFLKKDGTVWTSVDSYRTFEPFSNLDNVVEMKKNNILKADGTVWTWSNEQREYTDNEKMAEQTVTQITGLEQIQKMYNLNDTKIGIDTKARLWFWGSTITGMSDGTTYHEQPSPILLTSIEDVKEAYMIERSILVLTNNGKVYEASYDGVIMPPNPKFNLIASNVEQIKSGVRHIIMHKNDGSLWGWGVNKNAELGHGDYIFMYNVSVPVQSPITVLLNGESIQLTNGAIVKGGQAFVPIRSIFEQLGASISWDNTNKVATVTQAKSGEESITIQINYKTGEQTLNGKVVSLQNKPFINTNISYLPLRFISETLGAKVDWTQQDQKIIITM